MFLDGTGGMILTDRGAWGEDGRLPEMIPKSPKKSETIRSSLGIGSSY